MDMTPETCRSMTELRTLIDDLDGRIVELLAARGACIDRAIDLKRVEGLPARIDARIEEVVANARRAAGIRGLDPDLAERLWREIIEWSIAREDRAFTEAGENANGC
jgi:isochorismate pyruvate lyase